MRLHYIDAAGELGERRDGVVVFVLTQAIKTDCSNLSLPAVRW
uniref:Uncharacterized protein n=1 Tax=Arundo donax TaxID=35708 RepID=A0A0A8YDH1_ARUDO